jgi:uncharacterized protein YutE (UPF0331/DUF86 family)
MSTDDVALNKAAVIERCIGRIRAEHAGDDRNLRDDLTKQDSILLNLQRACEAAIDLAMHLVRRGRLGIPQDSREAFDLLVGAQRLDADLGERLKRMVGFRNIAVHDYQALSLDIVSAIVRERLGDLGAFAEQEARRAAG